MSALTAAVEALLKARRAGTTLRRAAAVAGVHVATVCRWQARDVGAVAPCPLAPGLPAVQGPCGHPTDSARSTVLALRPLAVVRMGEFAAAGTAKLPAMRCSLFLVLQPQEHRLRGLRRANEAAPTG